MVPHHLLFTSVHAVTSLHLSPASCAPFPFRPAGPPPSPPKPLLDLHTPARARFRKEWLKGEVSLFSRGFASAIFLPRSYKADERPGGSQKVPSALESLHIEGCWPILKELFWRRKKKPKRERIVLVLMAFIYFPDCKSNMCSLLKIWKILSPKELRKKQNHQDCIPSSTRLVESL